MLDPCACGRGTDEDVIKQKKKVTEIATVTSKTLSDLVARINNLTNQICFEHDDCEIINISWRHKSFFEFLFGDENRYIGTIVYSCIKEEP